MRDKGLAAFEPATARLRGNGAPPVRRISFSPAISPGAYLTRPRPDPPFPLNSPHCELFVRGSHALYSGLLGIGLEPGDQILAPAYHHGAEIEALIRAGLSVGYYSVTPDLSPDPDELADLVGSRCRALLVTHVLGFPQDAAFWRTWCDDRGLLLIENAAHAWSATVDGQPVGSHGDLSIFCPHKTIPVPWISASVFRRPRKDAVATDGPTARPAGTRLVRVAGPDLLGRHGDGSTSPAAALGGTPADVRRRTHHLASHLLHRLTDDPAGIRRENYRLLLEMLGDLVPEPFHVLPDGASPLGFPVDVTDKAALMERLTRLRIDAVDFWPRPHPSLRHEAGGTAARRRRSTVTLPVHQGLRADDLDRIADAVRPPRRPREKLRAEPVHDFETLRAEWSELALRTSNIFASWEWNRTWWKHFGEGRSLALTTLRDGRGSLRAILPLFLWVDRPLRIARFLGHVGGDQLQPICAPEDRPDVGRAMRHLLPTAGWDLLMGERLPATDAWGKRIGGRTLRRESSPVLFLHGSWEDTTKAWSPRFRSQLRKHERRLRADYDIAIRTVDDKADLEAGLDTFFELNRARRTEQTKFQQREPFHREFARQAFDNGWLRLQIIEADGVPAAAILNFRYCGMEFGYQSGWHPDFADHSIGTFQLLEAIRSAHADGIKEYRFLRGGESYKYRFASADAGLETVSLRRASVPGAVAAAGVALVNTGLPRQLRHGGKTDA